MYPVTDAYIKRIMSGSVTTGWSGTITAKNGQTFSFTEDDLLQGQTRLTREISSGDNIEIGTSCCAELSLSLYLDVDRYLLYNGTVSLDFTLYFNDGSSETVPCGTFHIIEPPTRNLGIVTIHAYDNMCRFDTPFAMLTSGTPYDILLLACVSCGVELGMTDAEIQLMPNGTQTLSVYSDATIDTYRDLIGFVASALCGVATIGVDGKLYIKQYEMTSVRTISADWRYDYAPRDYETSYSAISAVNMADNAVEVISNEGEDGLLYELGENPLLQSTEKDTRLGYLRSILDKLSTFSYTPFVAQVPCDPALSVGDVIDFTGGQAVSGKMSVITSIELTVNGGMTLKCVGGDPHTAALKTETDKKFSGMASNVSGAELVTYGYTNAAAVFASNRKKTPIMQLAFATASATPKVDIWMEVQLDTASLDASGIIAPLDPMTCTVTYALNGVELTYEPVETWIVQGKHLLSLHYYIPSVEPNTRYTWTVYITMYNGAATLEPEYVHAFLSGQGLVSEGDMSGLGVIDVFDEVYTMPFRNALAIRDATEVLGISHVAAPDKDKGVQERVSTRRLHTTFGRNKFAASLGDGVKYIKTADFITVADVLEMTVDRKFVDTSGAFSLKTEYAYESTEEAVDSGKMCAVTANTEDLRQVESVVVK